MSRRPRRLLLGFVALLAFGCGGKVIFTESSGSGSGGAGTGGVGNGGSPSSSGECVIGNCGDPCTKCTNGVCFSGFCDGSSVCQVGDGTCPL